MTDEQTRSLLLVVLGATAVWLWWSGDALNYVRPGLAPYLLAGGVVVGLLGLLPPLGLLGEPAAGHASGHGGHHHRTRVGWLLLVPVLVVLLVQPAALGSYAVSSRTVVPGGGDGGFPPLAAPVRGAVPMSMAEFVTRAVRDPGQSLARVRVRLVGFVAPAEGTGGYRLTRFSSSAAPPTPKPSRPSSGATRARGPATSGWRSREAGSPARPPSRTRPRPRRCSRPTWCVRSRRHARRMSIRSSSPADRLALAPSVLGNHAMGRPSALPGAGSGRAGWRWRRPGS